MISRALFSLVPGCTWTLVGDELYENIIWDKNNTVPIPSKQEVLNEVERLSSEYASIEYQRLRAKEYPSFADQFDLLYHGGYDAWKASINTIKDKYPKP
jgi:hypothetical protein